MKNLRDRGLSHIDRLLAGRLKAPSLSRLQNDLSSLSPEQQTILKRALVNSLDSALHDFLFALHERHDAGAEVAILAEGADVAQLSDGLHGELFTEDGWFARFSSFGHPPEDA
jgi:hypothetical protein